MTDKQLTYSTANYNLVQPTPPVIVVSAAGGKELLRIEPDGTITGEIENASEAGRVFVESIRGYLRQPTQTDANALLCEAKLAFEYGAGCDEGVAEHDAEAHILSWAGSPAAVSYANICAHLAALEVNNG